MRLSALSLVPLLAVVTSVDGRTYQGVLAPRTYRFNRAHQDASFDLVSDIFSMPIYVNSMMRQQDGRVSDHSVGHSMTPPYTVSQDPETGIIELTMEIPGVSVEELSVELEDDKLLRVKGSRTSTQNGSRVETQFDQVFQIDENVDPERLKVTLLAGILRVTAPKREQIIKRLPVQIEDPANLVIEAKTTTEEVKATAATAKSVQEVDGMTITDEDA